VTAPQRVPLPEIDPDADEGTIVAADLDGEAVAVIRHAQGWVAVPDLCTHAACALSEDAEVVDGTVLSCICHGSEFDLLTGNVTLGPASLPLRVTPLAIAGGRLTVASPG
jgi:nitrite reductase/ring-hydroxylating ferredoxin subunit